MTWRVHRIEWVKWLRRLQKESRTLPTSNILEVKPLPCLPYAKFIIASYIAAREDPGKPRNRRGWVITLIIAASCDHTRWMSTKMSFPRRSPARISVFHPQIQFLLGLQAHIHKSQRKYPFVSTPDWILSLKTY